MFAVLHAPGPGGLTAIVRIGFLAAGAVSLAVLARLQTRPAPLVPPELFRHWQTASPYLAGILLGTTIFGVDTYVPLFVQGARGGTAGAAGAVVTPLIFFWAVSAAAAGRLILRLGFRRTARLGAVLVLVGLAGLVAGALANASVAWISGVRSRGRGLGPSSMAQVLAIQHVAPERHRGVATSLVRSSARWAVDRRRRAGRHLRRGCCGAAGKRGGGGEPAARGAARGGRGGIPPVAPDLFRRAIERSLLPVFGVLLALAALNLFLASGFPETTADVSKTSDVIV